MNIDSTLIRNGQVYDGTGAEAQRVDVRIAKGVIQEVGPDLPSQGETIVDATGLLVCPGLIDLHVHTRALRSLQTGLGCRLHQLCS